jgi:protein-S-isoprenylcysteine O-methyltransferase Ste14
MIFFIIWSIWFISEIALNRLFRSGKTDREGQDRGTIRIIWITIGAANTLGILLSIFIRMPISQQIMIPYAGLGLILLGMLLRFFSIWSLGRYFTVDITIREDHKIKKNGIYGLVRHPSYTGSILSFIGFGLSLNNWLSLVVITLFVSTAMLKRIKEEEKLLCEEFAEEYPKYMKETYRLIPWIY